MSTHRERTKTGMEQAKASGIHVGRKQRHIDISSAYERFAAGESQRAIAESLGVSPALLSKRLKIYREQLEQQERADFAAIFGE